MAKENQSASAKAVAFGGVMAALALVIMCLGGLIPLATFICPVLCIMILQLVYRLHGGRIGWAWYAAVAVLSLLMGPDKEGAALFAFLGYYPLIKPKLDKLPLKWLWKLLYFNASIFVMYVVLIHLFGMAQLVQEYRQMGTILLAITLILGNVTFFLLDKVLCRRFGRR